jgi:hypothetical protein
LAGLRGTALSAIADDNPIYVVETAVATAKIAVSERLFIASD